MIMIMTTFQSMMFIPACSLVPPPPPPRYNNEFKQRFSMAFLNYEAGEWLVAKEKLEALQLLLPPPPEDEDLISRIQDIMREEKARRDEVGFSISVSSAVVRKNKRYSVVAFSGGILAAALTSARSSPRMLISHVHEDDLNEFHEDEDVLHENNEFVKLDPAWTPLLLPSRRPVGSRRPRRIRRLRQKQRRRRLLHRRLGRQPSTVLRRPC